MIESLISWYQISFVDLASTMLAGSGLLTAYVVLFVLALSILFAAELINLFTAHISARGMTVNNMVALRRYFNGRKQIDWNRIGWMHLALAVVVVLLGAYPSLALSSAFLFAFTTVATISLLMRVWSMGTFLVISVLIRMGRIQTQPMGANYNGHDS